MRKNWESLSFQHLQRRLVEQAPCLCATSSWCLPLQQNLMEALLGRVFREAIEEGEFAFLAGWNLKSGSQRSGALLVYQREGGKLVVARKRERRRCLFQRQ